MNPEIVYSGRFLRVCKRGTWEYVERTNASAVAIIVAVTPPSDEYPDGQLLLTEQFRPPVDKRVIALPAGLVGDVGDEEVIDGAKRELVEETGYVSDDWSVLASGPSSAGLTSEQVTFLLAKDVVKFGEGGGDEEEDIVVHLVPFILLMKWISEQESAGLLVEPKLYAGLYLFLPWGKK